MLNGPAGAGGAAHVFVADLSSPALDAEDERHLAQALRLRAGEVVTTADGTGSWRSCRYLLGGGLEPAGEIAHEPSADPEITIGLALVKGERPEWAVQKLTEIGVDRIVLFEAGRSVVRWDAAKAARNIERLGRIAREASMQSRRLRPPAVEGLATFAELAAGGRPVALAEPGGEQPDLAVPTVLVGPEGGWSDEERAVGLPVVGLGPTVLRAETAAVAAGVLWCALRNRSM